MCALLNCLPGLHDDGPQSVGRHPGQHVSEGRRGNVRLGRRRRRRLLRRRRHHDSHEVSRGLYLVEELLVVVGIAGARFNRVNKFAHRLN